MECSPGILLRKNVRESKTYQREYGEQMCVCLWVHTFMCVCSYTHTYNLVYLYLWICLCLKDLCLLEDGLSRPLASARRRLHWLM